ncbi:MAG: hypothetical protein ABSA85_14400 [Terracidiphilus sp.]|jgi:hypothetical protein
MNEEQTKELLKQTLPPVESNAEPGRDLWPAVLRRLDGDVAASHRAVSFSVPWFDWALLGALAVFAVSFPATIPVFLYYM